MTQGQNEPAEELLQLKQGADYAGRSATTITTEEAGARPGVWRDGGKAVGVCAQKQEPVAAFPGTLGAHDMLIYEGTQFPSAYKDGAFIAFHGSWNRAPGAQGGYNVVFQPMANGKASAPFVVFARRVCRRKQTTGTRRPSSYRIGGRA